jgi:hypothetical protein
MHCHVGTPAARATITLRVRFRGNFAIPIDTIAG